MRSSFSTFVDPEGREKIRRQATGLAGSDPLSHKRRQELPLEKIADYVRKALCRGHADRESGRYLATGPARPARGRFDCSRGYTAHGTPVDALRIAQAAGQLPPVQRGKTDGG